MGKAEKRDAPYSRDYAMTLDEVAEIMGISKERVRQIECKALRKIKKRLEARGIRLEEWAR